MKKRHIHLISLFIIIISLFIYFKNKPINYDIEYNYNDYKINEKYNKQNDYYSFKLIKNEYVFYFVLNHKYTTKRNLIKNINEETNEDTLCISINTKVGDTETICRNKKEYSLKTITNETNDVQTKFEDVSLYDNNYKYYEWNGYGLTDVNTKKTYNVLKKESYDNLLSYSYKDYIIFANYDEKNEFKLFYIFNAKTKKYQKLKLKTPISYDSYFQGIYNNEIYLFDRNKSTQYAINPKKKTINKTNTSEGAIYFDGTKTEKPINQFKYNELIFKGNNRINYVIDNNSLYYYYYDSDLKIKVIDNVQTIINYNDESVYYLSNGIVYELKSLKNINKLAESMEWQFHYSSQIYVF